MTVSQKDVAGLNSKEDPRGSWGEDMTHEGKVLRLILTAWPEETRPSVLYVLLQVQVPCEEGE